MPDQHHHPPATQARGNPRAGRWLVRAGYTVLFAAIAASVVESVLAWGDTSSVTLLVCSVVLWLASGMIAYGRKLRGELAPGAFSMGRGVASLPVALALAYYAPAIEQLAAWWVLLLPHLTHDLLGDTIGLPHLAALVLTILAAPVEIILALLVPQTLIIAPLSAIFGSDSPIVDSARDLVGGIEITDGAGMPAAGHEESTVWGGKSSLP
jgi:hypothetical protein